jgi:hypothetical protein
LATIPHHWPEEEPSMSISFSPPSATDASVHRIDPSDIELIATQPIDITSVMAAQMKAAENPSVWHPPPGNDTATGKYGVGAPKVTYKHDASAIPL